MTTGEKIRKRRYELSVTRQELAKQLGHGSNYIANVELGYRILGERELEIVADYTKRYESYQLIRMVCVGIMVYQSSPLSSPSFPYNPYYPL